jgi:hypothetical protein
MKVRLRQAARVTWSPGMIHQYVFIELV